MSSGKALDVATLAQTVLAGVVGHYAAATLDPGNQLPEYRAIRQGEPRTFAWDHPAFMVTTPSIGWGPPSAAGQARPTGPASAMVIRRAILVMTVVRMAIDPSGPVGADVMTAAGLVQARDMGLLSQAIAELCAGALTRYGQAAPGDVVVIGPQGQIVAVEGTLAITVLGTVGP